jgi:hypothetical protein
MLSAKLGRFADMLSPSLTIAESGLCQFAILLAIWQYGN